MPSTIIINVQSFLAALWAKVPPAWQYEIKSIIKTFLAAFVWQVGAEAHAIWSSGNIPAGHDALIAVGVAVTRSAVKFGAEAVAGFIAAQFAAWKARVQE